ncbi:uncharacterized protein FTJAE_13064 [Fusarium tjaetaba]|uniref:Uncharacterized protein n=1 Tax=Fusarium tjaetaba TaxID=1567544 RepID=A0A8H5QHP4_9HYPO|nr:uncharacterized protein FTJAE_13064 [Fusarium tjaetaba]KAF5616121.1 hypothetical protein FTJAE_13064 [Fusarium tjaetaba]
MGIKNKAYKGLDFTVYPITEKNIVTGHCAVAWEKLVGNGFKLHVTFIRSYKTINSQSIFSAVKGEWPEDLETADRQRN